MKDAEIERMVEELGKLVTRIGQSIPKSGELVVKGDRWPAGHYLAIRRLPGEGFTIEKGTFGQWQETLIVILERRRL